MSELDFSDSITIKITKVKYNGDFTHWESSLYVGDEEVASCTAPNMYGSVDSLFEYLEDEKKEWIKEDANDPRNLL